MYVTIPSEIDAPRRARRNLAAATTPTLAPARAIRRLGTGTHLYREGDPAHHIFEVQSGILRLTRVLENGRRQVISFALPGDIVGFPDGDAHHTDCEAIAPCELVPHRRAALESGEGDPDTHRRLLTAALREISAMQDHFMTLARKSATEKVASFLLALARRAGRPAGNRVLVEIPMTRNDIADFLGLTIETVSRTFTQLRKAGLIAMDGPHSVSVVGLDALSDAAQSN